MIDQTKRKIPEDFGSIKETYKNNARQPAFRFEEVDSQGALPLRASPHSLSKWKDPEIYSFHEW
jgi:hypothetical protein